MPPCPSAWQLPRCARVPGGMPKADWYAEGMPIGMARRAPGFLVDSVGLGLAIRTTEFDIASAMCFANAWDVVVEMHTNATPIHRIRYEWSGKGVGYTCTLKASGFWCLAEVCQ